MLRSYLCKKSFPKFRINYSTTPTSSSINTNATTSNIDKSINNINDNNINPPSFFHDKNDLPKKIDQNAKLEEKKDTLPKIHFNSEINQVTNNVTPPRPLFSNPSIPLPHPHPQPHHLLLPNNHINNDTNNNTNQHNNTSHSTNNNGNGIVSPSTDTYNYFKSYKDFCIGIAYLGVGTGVIFFIFDQHDRLDVSERQMKMMKKKQKELVLQMQTYKTKLNKIASENAKKNVMLQGKMQMHIALLREQLLEAGIDPVTIDNAINKFEDEVKVDVSGNTVELWVPGESKLKSLIPDPHEYNKKK